MKRYIFIFLATICLVSCIDPLALTPDIAGEIVAIEVEGQTRIPSITAATRTVNIELDAAADLSAVKVVSIALVETASCEIVAGSVLDLSEPLKVAVTTEADYEWTIAATLAYTPDRALPGGSFDEWNATGTRPTWNPWPEGGEWEVARWWDTGNEGVNLLAPSNDTPTEAGEGSPANPQGRAARLETVWAAFKCAGGNIYFGRFGELSGLDATCEIGHPWSSKPRALKGWYKYFPQPIDQVPDNYLALHPFGLSKQDWMGSIDSLHINIALWASPDGRNIPFTVNTDPRNGGANFVDFRRDTPGVIAYGSLVSGDEQAEWKEFELPLEYFDDGPLPENTQLFLQVTSSKNCNYFIAATTGGGPDGTTGSLMYIDEFQLVY